LAGLFAKKEVVYCDLCLSNQILAGLLYRGEVIMAVKVVGKEVWVTKQDFLLNNTDVIVSIDDLMSFT
jgi:hypothetical protein